MRTLLVLALLASACSHNTIPGTSIPDNPETRAVIDVFGRYKAAMEDRDASALLALTSPAYYDTTRLNRPMDFAALQKELPQDMAKLSGVKLELTVRDLKLEGDKAHIDYFQVLRYSVKLPDGGEKWEPAQSDDARMKFARVAGQWKIASGL